MPVRVLVVVRYLGDWVGLGSSGRGEGLPGCEEGLARRGLEEKMNTNIGVELTILATPRLQRSSS